MVIEARGEKHCPLTTIQSHLTALPPNTGAAHAHVLLLSGPGSPSTPKGILCHSAKLTLPPRHRCCCAWAISTQLQQLNPLENANILRTSPNKSSGGHVQLQSLQRVDSGQGADCISVHRDTALAKPLVNTHMLTLECASACPSYTNPCQPRPAHTAPPRS